VAAVRGVSVPPGNKQLFGSKQGSVATALGVHVPLGIEPLPAKEDPDGEGDLAEPCVTRPQSGQRVHVGVQWERGAGVADRTCVGRMVDVRLPPAMGVPKALLGVELCEQDAGAIP